MNTYLSSQFTYHAATKSFTAEASELTEGGRKSLFSRVFSDACDDGFGMISSKTGRQLTFYVIETIRDADGDVQCWKLVPSTQELATCIEAKGVTVTVFND